MQADAECLRSGVLRTQRLNTMSFESVTKDGRTVTLRQANEDDAAEFIRAVDSVAREGAYFIRTRFVVDEERERALIADAAERGDLILLAVLEGEIVGWVTLFRAKPEFLRHTCELGMGVVRGYRGLGVGSALVDWALKWAAQQGLEKVNLGVRASNQRARALYRRFGFIEEGHRVRDIKDPQGCYDDSIEMAYFVTYSSARIVVATGVYVEGSGSRPPEEGSHA